MRASEDQIKAAILHPEPEVRLQAVNYWSDAESPDPTIMPRVIQAVEQYGRETSFRILRSAEDLAQTPATIEWLLAELRRQYDLQDVEQDNYRFAVGLDSPGADPELIIPRHKEVLQLPNFPDQLRQLLNDGLRFHLSSWPQLWDELEHLGRRTMENPEGVTATDTRYSHRLIKAMGRYAQEGEKVILAMDRKVPRSKADLADWLEPQFVELAGRMRLKKAIPRIIRKMHEGEDAVLDQCGAALGRIGTDVVVEEIAHAWEKSDEDGRISYCEALKVIHTDQCIRRCMEFLADEDDMDVALRLGQTLLSHFCREGIENACQLVMEEDPEDLEPDQRDLKFRLVAIATAMGEDFPDYGIWHQEALSTNYGWGGHRTDRMAKYF